MESNVRAKTPLFLQQALIEEIKEITSGMLFMDPRKKCLVPLSVYGQRLPIPTLESVGKGEDLDSIDYSDDQLDDPVFKCPWCQVKIPSGSITETNGPQNVEVVICFGIFNEDNNNQGHQEILNLIQKVYNRFGVNPLLERQYTCTGEFEWALQEEDMYPYFFGAIVTTFQFTGFRREIKY